MDHKFTENGQLLIGPRNYNKYLTNQLKLQMLRIGKSCCQ
jgi:hypothetical protein